MGGLPLHPPSAQWVKPPVTSGLLDAMLNAPAFKLDLLTPVNKPDTVSSWALLVSVPCCVWGLLCVDLPACAPVCACGVLCVIAIWRVSAFTRLSVPPSVCVCVCFTHGSCFPDMCV